MKSSVTGRGSTHHISAQLGVCRCCDAQTVLLQLQVNAGGHWHGKQRRRRRVAEEEVQAAGAGGSASGGGW
jgi:hypothetical protein